MSEVRVTQPRLTSQRVKGDRIRQVLLPPTDKPGVHRDLKQGFAAGDNEPATRNAVIRALRKLMPRTALIQSRRGFLGQAMNEAVRLSPSSAKLNRPDRFRKTVSPTICVGDNQNVCGRSLDGRTQRVGLYPRHPAVSDGDGPNVFPADPTESPLPVLAGSPEGNDDLY